MSWWSRIRASWQKQGSRPDPVVRVMPGGVRILSADGVHTLADVQWNDVVRIQTYKVDLITTDCICLLLELKSGPAVQISEEWLGFSDLFGALEAAFPSIPANWYAEVMSPAFERNQRVLLT